MAAGNFERYYGRVFKAILWAINPFKKKIIKTECQVHRFINYQAIKIIYRFEYEKEFELFNYYLECLNKGVVWADQDFKSINHFYSPYKDRGLYGHNNAFSLTEKYYNSAIHYWKEKDFDKSMFYLGACVHILQDLTIPQHVNIRLLDSHRQYENFVKLIYDLVKEFRSLESPIIFTKLEDYVENNTKVALRSYEEYKDIEDRREKFYKITLVSLPLAQRTTAGCMLMFLKDVGFYEDVEQWRG